MSSGIPVISTLTAFHTPKAPPISIGMKSKTMDTGEYPGNFTRATIVATIAMTMPRMP